MSSKKTTFLHRTIPRQTAYRFLSCPSRQRGNSHRWRARFVHGVTFQRNTLGLHLKVIPSGCAVPSTSEIFVCIRLIPHMIHSDFADESSFLSSSYWVGSVNGSIPRAFNHYISGIVDGARAALSLGDERTNIFDYFSARAGAGRGALTASCRSGASMRSSPMYADSARVRLFHR